jgi:hypothetical protein
MSGIETIPRPLETPRICPLPCCRSSEQVADLLVAGFLYRRDQADTGIVEKNVQAAEMPVCLLNNLLYLVGIGHVERQRQDGISEALLQVGDICQLASGSRNLISALQCGFGPDAAKPSRGAGDKPSLIHC